VTAESIINDNFTGIPEPDVTELQEPLNWDTFLNQDLGGGTWLAGGLLRPGQQMSLVGGGKVGKSLFCLEWARAISLGLPFLSEGERPPVTVLYVDQENSHQEIQDRIRALGYTQEDLAGIVYLSFPAIPTLDVARGGEMILKYVQKYGIGAVFLDTVSRMIAGKENDSEPWLNLYRHTLKPLKALDVATVRLDHFGKDDSRGARGNSAKEQDVDAVWELSDHGRPVPAGTPLRLTRTHTRSGIGVEQVDMFRMGRKVTVGGMEQWAPGETRHVLRTGTASSHEPDWMIRNRLVEIAEEIGVPLSAGRDTIRDKIMKYDSTQRHGKAIWESVAAERKRRANDL
jgi:hypothetical protein